MRLPVGGGHRRGSVGLATRLFASQILVVVAGAATMWILATAVGPPIFRRHLRRAVGDVDPVILKHSEEAFRSASAVSIAVAVLAALAAAVGVSAYVSRRIARPITSLARAADQVAAGQYAVRVAAPGLGREFSSLAGAFNVMADRLESVETTRRRLLADLAHEMRTPVATIDAYLEGLEDGVATFDSDTATILRTQASRLAKLPTMSPRSPAQRKASSVSISSRPTPGTW